MNAGPVLTWTAALYSDSPCFYSKVQTNRSKIINEMRNPPLDLSLGVGVLTVNCSQCHAAFGVYRHWAPSSESAGFHGPQASVKKSQKILWLFCTSLQSMKTSWLARGRLMPLHSKGYMALFPASSSVLRAGKIYFVLGQAMRRRKCRRLWASEMRTNAMVFGTHILKSALQSYLLMSKFFT